MLDEENKDTINSATGEQSPGSLGSRSHLGLVRVALETSARTITEQPQLFWICLLRIQFRFEMATNNAILGRKLTSEG